MARPRTGLRPGAGALAPTCTALVLPLVGSGRWYCHLAAVRRIGRPGGFARYRCEGHLEATRARLAAAGLNPVVECLEPATGAWGPC